MLTSMLATSSDEGSFMCMHWCTCISLFSLSLAVPMVQPQTKSAHLTSVACMAHTASAPVQRNHWHAVLRTGCQISEQGHVFSSSSRAPQYQTMCTIPTPEHHMAYAPSQHLIWHVKRLIDHGIVLQGRNLYRTCKGASPALVSLLLGGPAPSASATPLTLSLRTSSELPLPSTKPFQVTVSRHIMSRPGTAAARVRCVCVCVCLCMSLCCSI